MTLPDLTWATFFVCDAGALAFIFRFVRWSSIDLNYTDKGVTFMYVLHLCLRMVTGLFPAVFLRFFSRLSKIYTEQYVICTLIHRMVPPRMFMCSEIYSLIMNTYVGIIIGLYVIVFPLKVSGFSMMLLELYQFFIAVTALVGASFLFCHQGQGGKQKKRINWTPSPGKQMRNTLVSALYVCVTVVVYFLEEIEQVSTGLVGVITKILSDYVFMAVVLGLLFRSARITKQTSLDLRTIPLV